MFSETADLSLVHRFPPYKPLKKLEGLLSSLIFRANVTELWGRAPGKYIRDEEPKLG